MKQSSVNCTVIVPAAGQGKRFGNIIPKQFLELNNIPIIIRTLMIFDKIDEVNNAVISIDFSQRKFLQKLLKKYDIKTNITLVKGGEERQDSIYNAINSKPIKNSDLILVHDAVRPLASVRLIKKIISSSQKYGVSIPGLPPNDTIKVVNSKGFVDRTLIRNELRKIQTPQGFKKEIFLEIYKQMKPKKMIVTDDASLAEQLGYKVKIINGEEKNIKITTRLDLLLAENILKNNKT